MYAFLDAVIESCSTQFGITLRLLLLTQIIHPGRIIGNLLPARPQIAPFLGLALDFEVDLLDADLLGQVLVRPIEMRDSGYLIRIKLPFQQLGSRRLQQL